MSVSYIVLTLLFTDDVKTKPEINHPPIDVTTELFSSVNFTCEAEGYPAPTYEWYKDYILIQGEGLSFLYIPEVVPSDRGSYYCKAINNVGETSSTPANLDIEGKERRRYYGVC